MAEVKHACRPLTSPLTLRPCKLPFMKTLAERIAKRMEDTGVEAPAIALAAGVERQAVYAWISGDTKSLRAENVFGAARALGCNPEWLATGEGAEVLPPGGMPTDLDDRAIDVARAWKKLPDFKQKGYAEAIMVDSIVGEKYPHIVRAMRLASTMLNPNYYKFLDVFTAEDKVFKEQLSLDLTGGRR